MDDLIDALEEALELHCHEHTTTRGAARDAIVAILRAAGRRDGDPLREAFKSGWEQAGRHWSGAGQDVADLAYDRWRLDGRASAGYTGRRD
jgi:hypothetical protein